MSEHGLVGNPQPQAESDKIRSAGSSGQPTLGRAGSHSRNAGVWKVETPRTCDPIFSFHGIRESSGSRSRLDNCRWMNACAATNFCSNATDVISLPRMHFCAVCSANMAAFHKT